MVPVPSQNPQIQVIKAFCISKVVEVTKVNNLLIQKALKKWSQMKIYTKYLRKNKNE
jgi:hypothetical protein